MVKETSKNIKFHYLERSPNLPARTVLKGFLQELFKKEGVKLSGVNYIFCSDEYLLKINLDFLDHNTYTDIITFQYTPAGEAVQSDIYISVDRVRENASQFGTSFKNELYRVIFHGALHLCGYKDKATKDVKLMRAKEDEYVRKYVSRETKGRRGSHI